MYLLDHPNPNAPIRDNGRRGWYYPTRLRPLVGIVIHCTAGLEDLDLEGVDHSAEDTARYAATTSRQVSWHSGSDTDSVVELLPASFTAFQCRGYNSSTYGHEISKRDMTWGDEPDAWVTATIERPGDHLEEVAARAGIPIRRITKAQLDRAIAAGDPSMGGLIGHRELDPSRRSDPGADFPWSRLLDAIQGAHMITRDTAVDPLADLEAYHRELVEAGVMTEHTQPGGVAFNDEIANFLVRYRDRVVRPEIRAEVKKAIAKAGVGGVTVGAVIAEIVDRLGG